MNTRPTKALPSWEALVARCVEGEREAWRELHARLQPTAAAFLRQMGVPPAERDDVVQDVFVQVYRYLDRFEHRADVKTWLYKICLSQARRARRRGAVRAAFGWLVGAHPEQAEPSIDGERSEAEARQAVEEALGRMSERQRLVFVLYEMHGLSGQAIAEIAGCPPATVRGRLREARLIFTAAFEGGERGVR